MTAPVEQSIEVWTEFAAAVEAVADLERPGLSVWSALAEALAGWLDDGTLVGSVGCQDTPRSVLQQVLAVTPEVGAPGGVGLDAIFDAAASAWIDDAASRINDGRAFVVPS